ncbi:MAG TPA: ABC transporter permease, partial [Luteibaculaceae bacterium]|nr:ABC transporter permease [Luteibaculaceae bacterium]
AGAVASQRFAGVRRDSIPDEVNTLIAYLTERFLYGLSVLFGVVTLVFLLFNIKPGDPARMLGGQFADATTLANINKDLGLDKPLLTRYLMYLNDLSPLSVHANEPTANARKWGGIQLMGVGNSEIRLKWPYLRRSYQSKQEVSAILAEHIPGTALLAISAMLFATLLGIVLGVLAAIQKDKFTDQFILVFSVLGMSGPSFFVAILFSWLGGFVLSSTIHLAVLPTVIFLLWISAMGWNYWRKREADINAILQQLSMAFLSSGVVYLVAKALDWNPGVLSLPGTGLPMSGSWKSIDTFDGEVLTLQNLILPALTLGIRPLAVIVQLTRSSLLEVMAQDYIRTARAKGLNERQIIVRHALRNALNPVVTAVSGWFASLLAGAVFIEYVFGWKGLGNVVFQALERDDLPVVSGAVLFFAAVFVLINIGVDLLYGWLDPRVRIKQNS